MVSRQQMPFAPDRAVGMLMADWCHCVVANPAQELSSLTHHTFLHVLDGPALVTNARLHLHSPLLPRLPRALQMAQHLIANVL